MAIKTGLELFSNAPEFFKNLSNSAVNEFGKIQRAGTQAEEHLTRSHKQGALNRSLAHNAAQASILAATKKRTEDEERLDKLSTSKLIAEIDRLSKVRSDALQARKNSNDSTVKAIEKEEADSASRQLAIARRLAAQREEVMRQGAGVSAGILGVGRNLIGASSLGNVLTMGGGVAGAGLIIKELGQAGFAANERIEKLRIGLQYTGTTASELDGKLKGLISSTYSMANSFGVDNHALQEATAHFLELGGKSDDLIRKQQAIILLSEKAGVTLEQAATYAVKGFDEDLNLKLTRFGIALDKSLPPAEQFNQFMRQGAPLLAELKEKAGGVSGDINRMKNEFDRAKDSAGLMLLQAVRPLIQGFNYLAEGISITTEAQNAYAEAVKKGEIPQEALSSKLEKILSLFTGNIARIDELNAQYRAQKAAVEPATTAIIRHADATNTDKINQDALNKSIEQHIVDVEKDAKDSTDSIIKRIAGRTIENRQLSESAQLETGINKQAIEAKINKNNRLNEEDKKRGKELVKIYGEIESQTHLASLGIGAAVDTPTAKGKSTIDDPMKAEQARFELHAIEMKHTKEDIEIGLLQIQIKYDNLISENVKNSEHLRIEHALNAAHALERIRTIQFEEEKKFRESVLAGERIYAVFEEELSRKLIEINKDVNKARAEGIKESNAELSLLMNERLGILKDNLKAEQAETKKYADLAKKSLEDAFSPITSQISTFFEKLPKGIGTLASGLMKIGIDQLSKGLFDSKGEKKVDIDTATIHVLNASFIMDLPKLKVNDFPLPPPTGGGDIHAGQWQDTDGTWKPFDKTHNGQGTNNLGAHPPMETTDSTTASQFAQWEQKKKREEESRPKLPDQGEITQGKIPGSVYSGSSEQTIANAKLFWENTKDYRTVLHTMEAASGHGYGAGMQLLNENAENASPHNWDLGAYQDKIPDKADTKTATKEGVIDAAKILQGASKGKKGDIGGAAFGAAEAGLNILVPGLGSVMGALGGIFGFAEGGYTGRTGGIVHPDEFVRNRSQENDLNKKFAMAYNYGGGSGGSQSADVVGAIKSLHSEISNLRGNTVTTRDIQLNNVQDKYRQQRKRLGS